MVILSPIGEIILQKQDSCIDIYIIFYENKFKTDFNKCIEVLKIIHPYMYFFCFVFVKEDFKVLELRCILS